MRAIARQAAAIGRTSEAVLAFAPGLLEGWLDPAAWRDQLTAPVEPADPDKHGELSGWRRLAATRAGRRHASARHQAGADRRPAPAASRAPRWTS